MDDEITEPRSTQRGSSVGILAIYPYFPSYYVAQEDLEQADGVQGKYTVGLGQEELCFASDREDPVSLALTAAVRLIRAFDVCPSQIGRIDVGTESGVDRSKSIKSFLCQHFDSRNVEGADHVHGCWGATGALLDAVNWIESSSWDGRLALVVATDVALYEPGSAARATGGAGATAMLVGPEAPLVLLPPPWRATFSDHCFDFFKPSGHPLYPVVDGPATKLWFLKAADACGAQLWSRLRAAGLDMAGGMLSLFDAFVSHAPFHKMARRGLSRLALQDMLRCSRAADRPSASASDTQPVAQCSNSSSAPAGRDAAAPRAFEALAAAAQLPASAAGLDPDDLLDSSLLDAALDKAAMHASLPLAASLMEDAAWMQRRIGNQYTASCWTGLAALLERRGQRLAGKKVLLFSYGSGVQASLLTLEGRLVGGGLFDLATAAAQVRGSERLDARQRRSVAEYDAAAAGVEAAYAAAPYDPTGSVEDLQPGTAYLKCIDAQHRRVYAWTSWQ